MAELRFDGKAAIVTGGGQARQRLAGEVLPVALLVGVLRHEGEGG